MFAPTSSPDAFVAGRAADATAAAGSCVEHCSSSTSGVEQPNHFLERLAVLRLSEWLEVGRSALVGGDRLASRATVRAHMLATITDHDLGLAAWYVRDAVETLAFLASHAALCLSRSDRPLFITARRAAEDAALAELVRAHLSASDHEVLLSPFAAYIEL